MTDKHAGGRPREYETVEDDRSDINRLTPLEALEAIKHNEHGLFLNEREYQEWFVNNVLERLAPYIADEGMITTIWQDKTVVGSRLRIDVLAETDNGYTLGFELKSVNPRYVQTHACAVMKGVGQTLLYEDLLCQSYGDRARVFLVSDKITERVARLVMRHDYLINLIEANQKTVTCIAKEEIDHG